MPSETKAKPEISMRHSKLSAKDAALLAGELNKPSWQSKNEGIHERVSFEDSIWGFDLAGGSFYKTPLRVTAVKPDSRAEKADIRPGDMLLRINDIDTSTLTIQEAHEIIIESGVHLRIAVTCPDDDEDSYNCWEDPIEEGYDSEEERRKEQELAKKRIVHAKVSSYWSLQWPWVSKRRVIYRESNCFLVPSKYEDKHRDKFAIQPSGPKVLEDIVLHSSKSETEVNNIDSKDGKEDLKSAELNTEKLENNLVNLDNKENKTNTQINGTQIKESNGIENELKTDPDSSINNLLSKDSSERLNETSNTDNNLDTTEEILTDIDEISEMTNENGLSEDLSLIEQSIHDEQMINEVLDGNEISKGDDKMIDDILSNGDDTMAQSRDHERS